MNSLRLPVLFFSAMLAMAALTGCQSLPAAQSEISPQARFADYRTFAVLPPRSGGNGVAPGDLVRLAGPLRVHLESWLQARGLTPAPADAADVVFELIGSVSTEISLAPGPERLSYRWQWPTRYPLYGYYSRGSVVETHDRGVLSVIAYDRAAGAVVWASWMEGSYHPGAKPETAKAALDALMAKLPVN